MPKTSAESKVTINVNVSPVHLRQAQQMAKNEGLNAAEFYRQIFIEGLNAYAEKMNKRMINEKLMRDIYGVDADDQPHENE